MATLDSLCEAYDDWGTPGDTPFVLKFDGVTLDIAAIHKEPDGSITIELEEAEVPKRTASIHWGGDGI